MPKHILVIDGNPDPSPERLSSALAASYVAAAAKAGHAVHRIDIGALEFPWLKNAAEFASEPDAASIVAARDAIVAAGHIVFIFPLWLGGPPALLKAFMEQVARAEFALAPGPRFPKGKLGRRSARVIVTMGMPALAYRLFYGAHGVKSFVRSILTMAGIHPVRTMLLGGLQPSRDYSGLLARMEPLARLGL